MLRKLGLNDMLVKGEKHHSAANKHNSRGNKVKMWSPRSADWCSSEHVLEESYRDWRSKTVFEYLYACYFKP